MKTSQFLLLTAILPGFLSAAAPAPHSGGLPFFFFENRSLADARVRYMLERPGLSASFLKSEVILRLKGHVVSMQLLGSNPQTLVTGSDDLNAHANFFMGNDQTKWVSDIPLHGSISYRELWPGVSMVYAGNGRTLKSEFHVAAGADPSRIRWTYGKPFRAAIAPDGALSVEGEGLDLREDAPVIYQNKDHVRVNVPGKFEISADNRVGFAIGDYDHDLPLIIDPTLTYSTFLGGSGQDNGAAVALDTNGNAYMAGYTTSTNFAQTGPVKWRSDAGGTDGFVAKFSALGDKLVYCTYLGGTGDDRALAIAVDSTGSAYITGYTTSTNFPVQTSLPAQRNLAGVRNAFVTKLTPAGNGISYSTYLGGSGTDTGYAIALDFNNRPYVVGDTTSLNFPVSSTAYQKTSKGGEDVFVTQVNSNGTSFLFSTYLGGGGDDHASGVAFASSGNVIVVGSTFSPDFPALAAIQTHSGGNEDAFLAEFSTRTGALALSTYLGGSGGTPGLPEEADGVAVDAQGNIFIAGTTSSLNFPVSANGLQRTFGGGNTDGFLMKLDPTASIVLYSTYVGGSSVDHVTGVAVDPLGYAFVVGYTASQDFPNLRAIQSANKGDYDGFLYKLNPAGSSLVYSTYLGGTGSDSVVAIAVDTFGSALLCGYTASSDFPIGGVLGSAQKFKYGTITSFMTKITAGWFPVSAVAAGSTLTFSLDQAHDLGTDGTNSTLKTFGFGQPGDQPIFGDWNGSGTAKVGIVRGNLWMLDYNGNGVWDGPGGGDRQFYFGSLPFIPVVGDWNGSGTIKAGAYVRGIYQLDLSGLIQGTGNGQTFSLTYCGIPGDMPVVGDWTGTGITRLGVVRNGAWFLDTTGTGNYRVFNFGLPTDVPIVGDWDGSGISRPGLFRNGTWILGYDSLNPSSATSTFTFGPSNAIPAIAR